MDGALYSSLCRTMRTICLGVQTTPNTGAPLLAEWQSWVKAFVAGLYHRESAVCAALSARAEADRLELHDPETGQLGHAAADLAWAAVFAFSGEPERAEALAHTARQRLAAQRSPAAPAGMLDGYTLREPDGGRSASVAASTHAQNAAVNADCPSRVMARVRTRT